MATPTATDIRIQDLKVGEKTLQAAISSLNTEKEIVKLVENTKICLEYLPTFSVCEADKELLQWIMPVIKKSLQKIYDENSSLFNITDDDFLIESLKENLHIATNFLTILKNIFEHLVTSDEIEISDVPSVTTIPAHVLLSTFEHCRNSSKAYKNSFNEQLLQIFCITKEVHTLFIRFFDSCLILENTSIIDDGINILNEVLDIICTMSNSLSDLNVKSLVMNWKGYASITQKFSDILIDHIDLKKPISCLNTDISKNLSIVSDELDCSDTKVNVVKVTGFLIKVALKIFDQFWNSLKIITKEVLILCCTICSFPTKHYHSQRFLKDMTISIDDNIYAVLEPFLDKLVDENMIPMLIIHQDDLINIYPFGLLNFLNTCLKCLARKQNSNDVNLADIVKTMFICTKQCFTEFVLLNNIFASIMVNISACVIMHQHYYEEIEIILLENVLQENIWCALLAIDIWSLVLKYSTEKSSTLVFMNLLKKYQELNFGANTYRLEDLYLKCLIRRIFKILPESVRYQVSQTFTRNDWKVIGFDDIPVSQKNLVKQICLETVEMAQEIRTDKFTLKNFVHIMENMEMLSTLDFHRSNMNLKNLVDMVGMLWEFDNTALKNGIFKYFFNNLCKITMRLIAEFGNKQLFMILIRLKIISSDDSYRLQVLNVLSEVCDKNANEFGQDGHKFFTAITNILHACLMTDTNNLIKQSVLEIIEKCSKNGKEMIVRDLAKTSVKTREDISNYLQKCTDCSALDKVYFSILGNLEYSHNCIEWEAITDKPPRKQIKLEKQFPEKTEGKCKKKSTEVKKSIPKTVHDVEAVETDTVNEAIVNIKSEVKCLMNVLKTEKMTAKNVSDLKIITNQLLSLM